MHTVKWGNPPVGLFNFPLDLWAATGRFADFGLRLEPHTHLTGEEYAAQIRAGAYDFGHIGTPVFLPAAVGSREYAVISAGVCDYAPFYLVAAPGVDSLHDVRGEPVVINKRQTCPGSLLEWHARREGLDSDASDVVELMARSPFDNYGQAFADGVARDAFRAGILYEPYVSLVERCHGWRVLAEYPELVRPANYALLVYARRRLLEQEPDLVRRVLEAYFAAVRFGGEQPQALHGFAEQLPFIAAADIDAGMRRERRHWNTTPGIDEGLLDRVQDELVAQRRVPADYDIRDYVATLH